MKLTLGKRYKAIGDCVMTKDREVYGVLELCFYKEYILRTDKNTVHSINPNTTVEL